MLHRALPSGQPRTLVSVVVASASGSRLLGKPSVQNRKRYRWSSSASLARLVLLRLKLPWPKTYGPGRPGVAAWSVVGSAVDPGSRSSAVPSSGATAKECRLLRLRRAGLWRLLRCPAPCCPFERPEGMSELAGSGSLFEDMPSLRLGARIRSSRCVGARAGFHWWRTASVHAVQYRRGRRGRRSLRMSSPSQDGSNVRYRASECDVSYVTDSRPSIRVEGGRWYSILSRCQPTNWIRRTRLVCSPVFSRLKNPSVLCTYLAVVNNSGWSAPM